MNSGNRISWPFSPYFLFSFLIMCLRFDEILINLFKFIGMNENDDYSHKNANKNTVISVWVVSLIGKNTTPMIMVNLHLNFYKQKFSFRNQIHAMLFVWLFIAKGPRASTQFNLIIIVRSHQFKTYLLQQLSIENDIIKDKDLPQWLRMKYTTNFN